ncbi:hypothetical protein CDD81_7573 [Ophiocordyceps australis]|uniref:Uncharacterized protein n=1 Tax=Ophiocordyceps australis TaxID=1399860 RepID=A0A2C5Y3T7_9HYPO|nr:hypothetical protein CDD81_7573 [Ophiocordyceps australis]
MKRKPCKKEAILTAPLLQQRQTCREEPDADRRHRQQHQPPHNTHDAQKQLQTASCLPPLLYSSLSLCGQLQARMREFHDTQQEYRYEEHIGANGQDERYGDAGWVNVAPNDLAYETKCDSARDDETEQTNLDASIPKCMLQDQEAEPLNVRGKTDAQAVHFGLCLKLT